MSESERRREELRKLQADADERQRRQIEELEKASQQARRTIDNMEKKTDKIRKKGSYAKPQG